MREVPDNAGRTLIEIYSGQKFIDRVKDLPLEGPGAAALEEAHRAGRPVILVTGHFGNYDAPRAALIAAGGMTGFLVDQHMRHGAPLTFFGHKAHTALSAAEMALKYDALLVPNGLDFRILVDAPIPHSDPETMTQALNDSLESLVREHMGQWFWIHRRWKDVPAPRPAPALSGSA